MIAGRVHVAIRRVFRRITMDLDPLQNGSILRFSPRSLVWHPYSILTRRFQ